MSEQDYKYLENKKKSEENNRQFKIWKLNAVMCEVNIKTYEKVIKNQEKLHNDIVNKLRLQIDRAVKNAKESYKNLDNLLKEKEDLHKELKIIHNFGKVPCPYCEKFYTPLGLPRHKSACSSKPEIKDAKEHKETMSLERKLLEAKKEALEKQIENLGKK